MTKLVPSALIASALLAGAAIAIAPKESMAQQPVPSLEQLMSPQERAAAGIAKLTPAERAALEAWLARYTATVSAVVRGLGPTEPGAPAQPAVPPTPVEPDEPAAATPRATPPAPRKLPPTAPTGAHVFRSTDGGTFIMLRDGTVWEIYYSDRPYTTVWQAGDFVQVRRDRARTGKFDFQLVNADQSRRVSARFAGFVEMESNTRDTGGARP